MHNNPSPMLCYAVYIYVQNAEPICALCARLVLLNVVLVQAGRILCRHAAVAAEPRPVPDKHKGDGHERKRKEREERVAPCDTEVCEEWASDDRHCRAHDAAHEIVGRLCGSDVFGVGCGISKQLG